LRSVATTRPRIDKTKEDRGWKNDDG
jgi:hypothetical protein